MRPSLGCPLIILWFAGCTAEKPAPVPIRSGEDACAACRMAVSQPEYAGEVVSVDGLPEVFDDLGCMLRRLAERPLSRREAAYVADFSSGRLVEASAAFYVYAPGLPSPMRSGLAAFSSQAAAEELARKHGGRVASWTDLPGVFRPTRAHP